MLNLDAGPAWMFTPATRPDRVLRAAELADVVVIDLEDAVAPAERGSAREALAGLSGQVDAASTVVRINALDDPAHTDDLAAVGAAGLDTVMVPKAGEPVAIARLAPLSVITLCETASGVVAAPRLAATQNVIGLMWGSVDLAADLGVDGTGGSEAALLHPVLDHSRWQILLAARAAGVLAIDHVIADLDDADRVEADARRAASGGFDAKACVHPRQLIPVRNGFRPDDGRVAWARRILASDPAAGAERVAGQLVDEAVRKQARRVLGRVAHH